MKIYLFVNRIYDSKIEQIYHKNSFLLIECCNGGVNQYLGGNRQKIKSMEQALYVRNNIR